MSYRCNICCKDVPPNQALRRHVIKKPDGNIAFEIPVCEQCQAGLRSGNTLTAMRRLAGPKQEPTELPEAVKDLAPLAAKVIPKTLAPQARPAFVKSFKELQQPTQRS